MNMLAKITKAIKNHPLRFAKPELSFESGNVSEFQRYVHSVLSSITTHYDEAWRSNKDRLYAQDSREVRDEFLIELFMMELRDMWALARRFKQLFWERFDPFINREIIHQAAKLFDRTNSFLLLIVDNSKHEDIIPVCHYKIGSLLELIKGELSKDNLAFLAETVRANPSTQITFVRALPPQVRQQLVQMATDNKGQELMGASDDGQAEAQEELQTG